MLAVQDSASHLQRHPNQRCAGMMIIMVMSSIDTQMTL
jgi:hypothetical protein